MSRNLRRNKMRGLDLPFLGSSFMKGMMLGALFCLLLSLLGTLFTEPTVLHQHHHVRAPSQADWQRQPEAMKQVLSQKLQVYCSIMVQPNIRQFWATANDTWAKHCDKTVFYTSEPGMSLEAVNLQEKDEWLRVRKALIHAFENGGSIRWFFIARATTFAIIENLKRLLLDKDSSQPFYLGRAVKSGQLEYVQYNSGVVLSYEALRQLVQTFQDPLRCPERGHGLWKLSMEKELALCLKYAGVYAENGEDLQGTSLFNSQSISGLISQSRANQEPIEVVESCCSDLAITFTGMSPTQMQFTMFGVYRLRPYGYIFHDSLVFKPPEGSKND
ncbi:C1GALT1-specific chaperone 1-like isoform X1 [Conger conger]|uniref:C1GALT1-specific chaperone 1-like isoform X1 n=2 Tax=Conger conger TaxID=82655 RepID=UPI002A59F05A|nr:C1GALT1-specific chaperone 1-like isoform X1 [Conger conger]XP_061105931.1 C1GALT1-specific chaperone 1-like isoform X1 [Conger conger]